MSFWQMRVIFVTFFWILCLTSNTCFGLNPSLSHKLATNRFLEELGFQNLQLIEHDILRAKLKDINRKVLRALREVSIKEGSKYTLQKYKTKIKQISEDVFVEIKNSLDARSDLLNKLDSEFQQINARIVEGDYRSRSNYKYGQLLLGHLNAGPFNKSIKLLKRSNRLDKVELINQILKLSCKSHKNQNHILRRIILLHKLGIEIELTKIAYLYYIKQTETDDFESRLRKIAKMFHLLTSFEIFLTGCFQSPFEISITKITKNTDDSGSSDTPDVRFVVYPNLELEEELYSNSNASENGNILYLNGKSYVLKAINCESYGDTLEYSEYRMSNISGILGYEIILDSSPEDPFELLEDSLSITEPKPSLASPRAYTEYVKAEVDVISPILSVESNTTRDLGDTSKDASIMHCRANSSDSPLFTGEKTHETLGNIDQEVKLHTRNEEIEQFNESENKVTGMNGKDLNLEALNSKKCLEFQHVCTTVRHLNNEQMAELDKNLFPHGVELPLEKDNDLIWSVSESLVENFGARKRLIEVITGKIIDFTLSINRLNTSPLMNTGEESNDQVSFYRGKHREIILILSALKDFLNSNSSQEISATRLRFIERFVPLLKRSKKIKPSDSLENKNKQMKIRNSLDESESSTKMSEIATEPSLYDLCTRFITILSVTKSVESFNDNSYKFSQKVCSMIFEQPIHNTLSGQDYAWLTGFTLVRTVNSLIRQHDLPEEMLIDHKNALRALNHSLSQKAYNFHQACTQSLVSQKSTAIYRLNISLHSIKPIMKISCAEYFGISVFLREQ